MPKCRYLLVLHVHGDLPAAGTVGPAEGSRAAGHPRPRPKVGWVPMASMDISVIPCMPGIILPPSLGAYKCVLCDYGVIMFFRKDPPQTQVRACAVWRLASAIARPNSSLWIITARAASRVRARPDPLPRGRPRRVLEARCPGATSVVSRPALARPRVRRVLDDVDIR